jgi:hypothetical protein
MSQVVLRQQPSVHAAYRAAVGEMGVSVASVYNKLNGVEAGTSAALVDFSTARAAALIAELDGARPPLLAGVRIKVLDGNALAGRDHRLLETRGRSAASLPGKALAVFDPALELIKERAMNSPTIPLVSTRCFPSPSLKRCWGAVLGDSFGVPRFPMGCSPTNQANKRNR